MRSKSILGRTGTLGLHCAVYMKRSGWSGRTVTIGSSSPECERACLGGPHAHKAFVALLLRSSPAGRLATRATSIPKEDNGAMMILLGGGASSSLGRSAHAAADPYRHRRALFDGAGGTKRSVRGSATGHQVQVICFRFGHSSRCRCLSQTPGEQVNRRNGLGQRSLQVAESVDRHSRPGSTSRLSKS